MEVTFMMGGILAADVLFVVGVIAAVIIVLVLALVFLLDVWSEGSELLGEIREWWHDRRD